MKISELEEGSRKVDVEATVESVEETREVNTKYGKKEVANATISDGSGEITLVLWGEDSEKVSEGDSIKIENGYVKEWNGDLQLSVGRYGKLLVNE